MQRNRQTVRITIPFDENKSDKENLKALRKEIIKTLESKKLVAYQLEKSFVTASNHLVGTLKIITRESNVKNSEKPQILELDQITQLRCHSNTN